MADLPGDFWSGWIIILTVSSLLALTWMILSIYAPRKKASIEDDTGEPVWDENLREGSNPPPWWWFWLIFITLVISVIYLILYPGLGSFKGVLDWSQDSRLQSSHDHYEESFDAKRSAIANSSLAELQNSTVLMATAERVFARNCAACHGANGRGQAEQFPNLKDIDWQWGGAPEQIEHSIRHGRIAAMVSWQAVLGDEKIDQLVDYVIAMRDPTAADLPGQTSYAQFCIACHGVNGEGNELLGAPNLVDDSWLYGGSLEAIRFSISQGRSGMMPAFGDRLDDAQIKLLVAWLAR